MKSYMLLRDYRWQRVITGDFMGMKVYSLSADSQSDKYEDGNELFL